MDQLLERAIEQLRSGNQNGFQIIYDQTHNYVYSQARMLLRNESDASDLVQEVYINAYRSIGSLQDNQKIYSWLGGIAFRQATKILRKQKDVLLQDDEENIFENVVELDPDVQPEAAMDRTFTKEVVAELIEQLPPLQQAALTAFYYDQMSIRQIAQEYNCSENTIKSRLNYAKKNLKESVLEREKRDGVKLYSVSPALVLAALSFLFAKEPMPESSAALAYQGISSRLSLSKAASVSAGTVANSTAAVKKAALVKTILTTASSAVAITAVAGSFYIGNKLQTTREHSRIESQRLEKQVDDLKKEITEIQKLLDSKENDVSVLSAELLQKKQEIKDLQQQALKQAAKQKVADKTSDPKPQETKQDSESDTPDTKPQETIQNSESDTPDTKPQETIKNSESNTPDTKPQEQESEADSFFLDTPDGLSVTTE